MLIALVVLQILIFIALLALLLRKQQAAAASDPRAAQLPDQLARLDIRGADFDAHARTALAQMRDHISAEALRNRDTGSADFTTLRTELAGTLHTFGRTLDTFRADQAASADKLRETVQHQMDAVDRRLAAFSAEAARGQIEGRDALHGRLTLLATGHAEHQERLRAAVEDRLDKLNSTNAAKLEEMRVTVDEKLHATLQSRLTESFGQVTTHLGAVQKGLGEMKELATGVGDLKKVLSSVRSRGVVGEFQLGQQLEQMFSPEQYIKNARIKPHTQECVEYALKFPNGEPGSYVLLPIDAKFPKDDWERLEHAYDHGSAEEIAVAGKAFERAIRTEGKRICEKYIDPPTTMPHAIMFLPTENLYAEVVRRPGLQSEIQGNCHVTIAGPSTFMAILTSFQMGFHTLAIQKKGDEVWRVLSSAKNEFDKFGGLMEKVEKQVGTVQNTLRELGGKTRTINRALKNVSTMDTGAPVSNLIGFDDIAQVAPHLAAVGDDD